MTDYDTPGKSSFPTVRSIVDRVAGRDTRGPQASSGVLLRNASGLSDAIWDELAEEAMLDE